MIKQIHLEPIGFINKKEKNETQIIIFKEYQKALLGLETFSHIIVLWWISGRDTKKDRSRLIVRPKVKGAKTKSPETGVFACRAPIRPNPIGLSVVKLLEVKDNILTLQSIDAFNESPVIDLKPYIPHSDCILTATIPQFMSVLAKPQG